ncbi:MAG: hypothetical protein HY901_17105 [Deltaproteobacteria bacterium]|nr:hypothetical protein [Deltaproteobacteria bacterium]
MGLALGLVQRIACLSLLALSACDALIGEEPPRPPGAGDAALAGEDVGSGGSPDANGVAADAAAQPPADAGGAGPDASSTDVGCLAPSYACATGCCVRVVAAGGYHSCATDSEGDVYCWGEYGAEESGSEPTRVMGASKVKAIAAGWGFTCAIDSNQTLACWGTNQFGELGIGVISLGPIWTATPSDLAMSALAIAGGKSHGCAIAGDKALHCWGMNDFDQLGLGGSIGYQVSPQPVLWTKRAIGLAAGWKNTCAVTESGALYCWGNNTLGELGDDSMIARDAPFPVASMQTGVTALAISSLHACAVKDRKVFCWGNNDHSQVVSGGTGCNTTLNACYQPNDVGVTGAVDVAVGSDHSCALLETGKVVCWGSNQFGQIGHDSDSPADVLAPAEVFDLAEVGQISAGLDHTCAVRRDQIWCWGSNSGGQLARATATITESRKPVLVTW